ncbi:MAG: hypothetical protein M1818_003252 [Claussenomyces sp. TS43310]|nr:MAG: hypothetical protein M1818_003252 [Claussenomyces sp. TS43310]
MTQSTRQFVVTQPFLGSPLQFQPVGKELDDLINDYLPGPVPMQQKKGQLSLQFLNSIEVSNASFPVSIRYQVPIAVAAPTARSSGLGKRSREETRDVHVPEAKRLPGFSIMTKDGVDITDYASRGPKTKEQRDHAALMRKLKACSNCKRSKQRCDPSHHAISAASTNSSSYTSTESNLSARHSFASQSSGSRTSASPRSTLDSSFKGTPGKAANLVAYTGKRFSPYDSPRSSFSPSEFPSLDAPRVDYIEQRRQALIQKQAEIDAELAALTVPSFPQSMTPLAYQSHSSPRAPPGSLTNSHLTPIDPPLYQEASVDMDESLFVPGLEDLEAYSSELGPYLATSFDYSSFEFASHPSAGSLLDSPVSPYTSRVTPEALCATQRHTSPSVADFDIDQWLQPTSHDTLDAKESEPAQTNTSPERCFYVNGKPFDYNQQPLERRYDFVLYPDGSQSYWTLDAQRESRVMVPGHSPPLAWQDRSLSPDVDIGQRLALSAAGTLKRQCSCARLDLEQSQIFRSGPAELGGPGTTMEVYSMNNVGDDKTTRRLCTGSISTQDCSLSRRVGLESQDQAQQQRIHLLDTVKGGGSPVDLAYQDICSMTLSGPVRSDTPRSNLSSFLEVVEYFTNIGHLVQSIHLGWSTLSEVAAILVLVFLLVSALPQWLAEHFLVLASLAVINVASLSLNPRKGEINLGSPQGALEWLFSEIPRYITDEVYKAEKVDAHDMALQTRNAVSRLETETSAKLKFQGEASVVSKQGHAACLSRNVDEIRGSEHHKILRASARAHNFSPASRHPFFWARDSSISAGKFKRYASWIGVHIRPGRV